MEAFLKAGGFAWWGGGEGSAFMDTTAALGYLSEKMGRSLCLSLKCMGNSSAGWGVVHPALQEF